MLERKIVDGKYVMEVLNAVSRGSDNEDLSDACNEAFQELESHFVRNVCGGSEQIAWDFMDALSYEATVGKPYDMNFIVGLAHAATVSPKDIFYLKYMGVLLSLYERINTDVLVANNQYRMYDNTIGALTSNYNEVTVTYALWVYQQAKDVFSGFINTNIISADDAAAILFRYYQSQNTAGFGIEHVIRQALADGDHIKALVYLIIVCKANASEALKYLEGIRLYSM
jgi:hypothetical protein